jgi:hypothetical protein
LITPLDTHSSNAISIPRWRLQRSQFHHEHHMTRHLQVAFKSLGAVRKLDALNTKIKKALDALLTH